MIFLSASIPTPGREFFGTEDIIAIRESIMAFTKVCIEKRQAFYFGGHPAITPLVWEVAKDYSPSEFTRYIRIYQSTFFIDKTPKAVEFFDNIVWTAKQDDDTRSIELMRKQMFCENKTRIAVFIGGMAGIIDEYKMIKERYPKVIVLPLATTGAASEKLYYDLGIENPDLSENYSYISVFEKYIH